MVLFTVTACTTIGMAQGGPKWSVSGNNIGDGDYLGTNNNYSLVFQVNGLERMRLNPDGNSGIGTLLPTATFHVEGSFRYDDGTAQAGYVLTTDEDGNASWQPSPLTSYWTQIGNDLEYTLGSVRIGSITQQRNLSVSGSVTTTELSVVDFVQTKTGLLIENVLCITGDDLPGGDNDIWTENNGDLRLQSKAGFNSNTLLNCGTTGFVGIGQCLPQYKLDVLGDANISGNFTISGVLKIGTGTVWIGGVPGDNFIYSDGGNLQINANEGVPTQPVVYNTEINPDEGQLYVGTSEGDVTTGDFVDPAIFGMAVGRNMIVTGQNSTIAWRGANLDAGGAPQTIVNTNGDIALCLEDRPNGDPGFSSCGNPIKGLNFFRPFPHDAGFQNWDLFVSTLPATAGNIGIGTPYPVYRLTVNGVIGSREIIVETTDWCDYVFQKDYELMPTDELEDYIEENGHLPGVEPAAVYEEEGLPLAEITRMQMEKIEELTLYMLQQQQMIEELNEEVLLLQSEVELLKTE